MSITTEQDRRPGGRADRPSGRPRSVATQRAMERRRKRIGNEAAAVASRRRRRRPEAEETDAPDTQTRRAIVAAKQLLRDSEKRRQIPFVAVLIALLVGGVALTLLLSTHATEQSYQLAVAQERNNDLRNERDALARSVGAGQSPPELAKRATAQGLVLPDGVIARLVVGAGGKAKTVGEPIAVQAGRPLTPPSGTARGTATPGAPTDRGGDTSGDPRVLPNTDPNRDGRIGHSN